MSIVAGVVHELRMQVEQASDLLQRLAVRRVAFTFKPRKDLRRVDDDRALLGRCVGNQIR